MIELVSFKNLELGDIFTPASEINAASIEDGVLHNFKGDYQVVLVNDGEEDQGQSVLHIESSVVAPYEFDQEEYVIREGV